MCGSCLNGYPNVFTCAANAYLPSITCIRHTRVCLVNVTVEEEIDGEAFILMSADDIVSMVKSKGVQLKLAEKETAVCYLPCTGN